VVDELGLDETAVGGEDEGYVPCLEEAAAGPADDSDAVAVFGEDEGYTPDGTLAASVPPDDTDSFAIFGQNSGFVAKPCGGCDCGITDSWTRSVTLTEHLSQDDPPITGDYWGTADCGLDWSATLYSISRISADGSRGVIALNGEDMFVHPTVAVSLPGIAPFEADSTATLRFSLGYLGDPTASADYLDFRFFGVGAFTVANLLIDPTHPASSRNQISWSLDVPSGSAIPASFWAEGVWYEWTISQSAGVLTTSITDGLNTYSDIATGPAVSYNAAFSIERTDAPIAAGGPTDPTDWPIYFDWLVTPITRCELSMYDTFYRNVSGSWGTASSGAAWTNTPVGGVTLSVVGAGFIEPAFGRVLTSGSHQNAFIQTPSSGPWNGGFDMTFSIWCDQVGDIAAWDWADDSFNGELFIEMGTGSGLVAIYTAGGFVEVAKTDWLANTWYRVKWSYTPDGTSSAKVWLAGVELEPALATASCDAGPALDGALTLTTRGADVATDMRLGFLDFAYAGKPCYYIDGVPVYPS
jgi:hypothetical protein